MATIGSLPPETLLLILELAGEHDLNNVLEHHTALRTLAAASLVTQSWTEPAQAVMWRKLRVADEGRATRIAASPVCGKYRTARVALWILGQHETIEGALGRLKGITWLEFWVWGPEPYGVGWLGLPSLQDLTTLILNTTFVNCIPVGLVPSFRLRNLTLCHYATSLALIHALFVASSSTLLSVTLDDTTRGIHPALLASLPLLATSLVSLSLFHPIPAGLGIVLSAFPSLTSLNLHLYDESELSPYDSLLAPLLRPIESIKLIVGVRVGVNDDRLLRGLTQAIRGLAGSKVTEVKLRHSNVYVESFPEWKEFTEVCSGRGIKVVDDDD